MQLQVVIRQLELQNRELQQMVVFNNSNDKEMKKYLEEHRLHVATQIQKLKILKDYLETAKPTIVNRTQTLKRMESTPLVSNTKVMQRGIGLDMFSPIGQITECSTNAGQTFDECSSSWHDNRDAVDSATHTRNFVLSSTNSMPSYSLRDISSWIGGHPTSNTDIFQESSDSVNSDSSSQTHKSPVHEMHSDLDEVLAKLQQILANNFMLDESLGNTDNGQLKSAVTEVEGMLTSLIDGVESTKANSVVQEPGSQDNERETVVY